MANSGYTQMSVAEIVERFGVSERTARRHRSRGTLPAADRRAARRNGKVFTMPAQSPLKRDPHTALSRDLIMARNAIRRVARADRFTDEDLELAMQIYDHVAALTDVWRTS